MKWKIAGFRRNAWLWSCSGMMWLGLGSCTQEQQNKIAREIQNYTGTDGVIDVMSGGKVMYRFIKIDKLTTADATGAGRETRDYRYGYGYLDRNQNYQVDPDERKIYFEVSNYSTEYIFYENPNG